MTGNQEPERLIEKNSGKTWVELGAYSILSGCTEFLHRYKPAVDEISNTNHLNNAQNAVPALGKKSRKNPLSSVTPG
jgi:hypothetical protein